MTCKQKTVLHKMAFLAVLALSAMVAESAIAAPSTCSAADVGKGFCLTCRTKAKCVTAGSPPESRGDCTVAGEACTVLAGVAACKPIANTACSCAKQTQCDAYDPDSLLTCLSGGLTVSNDCSKTAGSTCVNGACITTTTTAPPVIDCTGAPDGFLLVTPMCNTAAYCLGGVSQGPTVCKTAEYFDMDVGDCLPLPPVPCAGCGTGACPDKSDCSKWYICDVGVVLDEETCEDPAPVFDVPTNECKSEGVCTGNDHCTYALTTTAGTTTTTASSSTTTTVSSTTTTTSRPALCTAANVGQRYTFTGNCKKYWSCRKVSTTTYAYVESTCLSTLVFNAVTSYCDTQANVPGCVPPS